MFRNIFNRNADQLAKEAIADYEKGKDEFRVIEKLQKALKIGIKHYPLDKIHLHIGASYFDLAMYEEAKEAYKKGLEYNSKNHSLLSNIGLCYQKLGNPEKSIPYYEASLKVKPDNSYAYHNIGLYLYENGKHFEAIENLNNAIKINPGLSVSYAVKARCLAYIGLYKDAEKTLKQAVKNGYDNGKVLKNELNDIKTENPQSFIDITKFKEFVSNLGLKKEEMNLLFFAQEKPWEFWKDNNSEFDGQSISAFEINQALHWKLLVIKLTESGKIINVDELTEPSKLLTNIRSVLIQNNFDIKDSLDEFEETSLDLDDILYTVSSKLKLSNSIELLNIWTSDTELNILPIDKNKWELLKYPFVDSENGFGKIHPLATNEMLENYLTNE